MGSIGKPQDLDVVAGLVMKKLRQAAGLTQSEVAAKLGISYQQVQKYENGRTRLTLGRLVELSEVLGTTSIEFMQMVTGEAPVPQRPKVCHVHASVTIDEDHVVGTLEREVLKHLSGIKGLKMVDVKLIQLV